MSESAHPYEVKAEPENLPGRPLTTILVVGVIVTIVCAIIVQVWLPRREPVVTSVRGSPERIGPLEQTLIGAVHTAERRTAEKQEELRRYGWVNKEHGVVAIPIDRAMQLVVEGHR